MFCSATPTFTKRSRSRSASGSSTMKPRSPVRNTTRRSRSAISCTAPMNAFLIGACRPVRGHGSGVRCVRKRFSWTIPQLAESLCVLLVGHRHVVPGDRVLHVGGALAEGGSREKHVRLRVGLGQALHRVDETLDIVAVDLVD